jgi:hypothetical protein
VLQHPGHGHGGRRELALLRDALDGKDELSADLLAFARGEVVGELATGEGAEA